MTSIVALILYTELRATEGRRAPGVTNTQEVINAQNIIIPVEH